MILALCVASWSAGAQTTYFVATGGSDANDGLSAGSAFATIGRGLSAAAAGDSVLVGDGDYQETINAPTAGSVSAPITLRAANARMATIRSDGQRHVFDVADFVVEGFVFDGAAGAHDLVRVGTGADRFVFRNNEVRNGARDAIDLGSNSTSQAGGLTNVVIEDSYFHHMLWWDGLQSDTPIVNDVRRRDAHAIVAGGVEQLTIRNTQVDHVSGDALQLQDGFWSDVRVEGVDFRNSLLPEADPFIHAGGLVFPNAAVAGTAFANGVRAGENAIDTKQDGAGAPRGRLTVRGSMFTEWGSDGALIANPAALNLKEEVEVIVDGNVFSGNAIALRLRGPAQATDPLLPPDENGAVVIVANNVFTDHDRAAIRLEDHIQYLNILNNTFGDDLAAAFEDGGGAGGTTVELGTLGLLNNLFLAGALPAFPDLPLLPGSNLAADETGFIDVLTDDYALAANSPAIDAGVNLLPIALFSAGLPGTESFALLVDHIGLARHVGDAFDVGAFEFQGQPVPLPAPVALLLAGCVVIRVFGTRNIPDQPGLSRITRDLRACRRSFRDKWDVPCLV